MHNVTNVDSEDVVDQKQKEKHGLYLILIMAILGLLTIFVETMLVPALPTIAEDLVVRSSDLAWALTAYTLAGAVCIPIIGKMGEMWGRKKILFAIMVIYVLGLVGAAVSWDFLSLVVFRAVQGVGMGAIPLLMGMAKDILPPRMLPVGIGLISAMIGVGAALGLVVGGLLVSVLGWKEVFWAVLPVVVIVVAIVHFSVPEMQIKRPTKMDLIGSALLGMGLLTFLLALSRGSIWGWSSMLTLGLFVSAIIFFLVFFLQEKRYSEPIIRLDLLRNRNISVAYVTMFFIGMVMFMVYQTLPYFIELPEWAGGFGITSQVIIGLFLLPNAVAQLISSPMGGKYGQWIGHAKILTLGFMITVVGLISLSLLRDSEVSVLVTMAIFGAGIGLAMVGQTNLLSCACSKENFGSASAVNSMILTIGMSTGPVVASLIIEGFVDASEGYAYCWGIAALLALLAAIYVSLNKAKLCVGSDGPVPHEERS
jgi:predicted MFS family arabinose efflux permease